MDPRTLLPLLPMPFRTVARLLLDRLDSMEARIAAMEKRPACSCTERALRS